MAAFWAIGANCFNMAVVLPYVSYAVYRAIGGKAPLTSKRRVVGATIGGWTGLTMAAFFTAVEFGIPAVSVSHGHWRAVVRTFSLSVQSPRW